jgi:alpha-L-fucosidase
MDNLGNAKSKWMELGYGMFIHFGVNTFAGSGWGDGKFPARDFNPDRLDPNQWADMAAEAGMKYAVLTTKHHDGFCLWPSKHTEYSVKNSTCGKDVVALYVEAFRKAGLKTGLYYSLWDRNYPAYDDDAAYAAYMKDQMTELLTNYGPILEMWFDGGWDKDHPTKNWAYQKEWESDPRSGLKHGEPWDWQGLYKHIHALQPDCLVIQNSSSDRPGVVKYPPVDVRTSEHYDFVWRERVCKAENGPGMLPLEYCTSLTPDWFWSATRDGWVHPTAGAIADWLDRARETDANLLLNIGPDKHGLLPEYHREFLRRAKTLLRR